MKNMRWKTLTVGLLFSASAHAADLCQSYVEYCPGYRQATIAGGSYPSFSDTLNVNPASIPTTDTPIGVEVITTTGGERTKATTNFALIKGFKKVGMALANNTDETLYAYNLSQSLDGTGYTSYATENDNDKGIQSKNTVMSTFNLGAAISPLPDAYLPWISSSALGINIRYNQLTKKWEQQFGLSFSMPYFTLGGSYRKSEAAGVRGTSSYIPSIATTTATAGLKIAGLGLEYTQLYLRTTSPIMNTYPYFKYPVTIFTGLLDLDKVHFSYARRQAYNLVEKKITRTLFGVHVEVLAKLAVAFQHNYIPGTNSLSVQLLF